MAYGNNTPLPQERLDFSHPIWHGLVGAMTPFGAQGMLFEHLRGSYLELDQTSGVQRTTIASGRNRLYSGSTTDSQTFSSIAVGDPLGLNGASAMSVITDHVHLGSGHSAKRVMDCSTGGNGAGGWAYLIQTSGNVSFRVGGTTVTAQTLTPLASSHDAVVGNTWDDSANSARYFINGSLVHSEASGGSGVSVSQSATEIKVGNVCTGSARSWHGLFRRLFLFNEEISDQRMRRISDRSLWRQYVKPYARRVYSIPAWLYAPTGGGGGSAVGAGLLAGSKLARPRLAA